MAKLLDYAEESWLVIKMEKHLIKNGDILPVMELWMELMKELKMVPMRDFLMVSMKVPLMGVNWVSQMEPSGEG
eukprot:scaffold240152_cov76-Cyclotella_meneghiniana.AAC.2